MKLFPQGDNTLGEYVEHMCRANVLGWKLVTFIRELEKCVMLNIIVINYMSCRALQNQIGFDFRLCVYKFSITKFLLKH